MGIEDRAIPISTCQMGTVSAADDGEGNGKHEEGGVARQRNLKQPAKGLWSKWGRPRRKLEIHYN